MDGIGIVYKPDGITSHDVVARVRRILKFKKVGHAGTLDPLATGLLIILVGSSTRLFDKFVGFDKAYTATMLLGVKTVSADIQGKVLAEAPCADITRERVEEVFKRFLGVIQQVPPMVSAVKYKGERLYKLARKGINVERPSREVRVDALDILEFAHPYVKFHLACSKGTYVRQIAEDAGDALGCGACITQIERTKVGPFLLSDAVSLEEFNEGCLRDQSALKAA